MCVCVSMCLYVFVFQYFAAALATGGASVSVCRCVCMCSSLGQSVSRLCFLYGAKILCTPIHHPGPWESVNQPGPDPGLIHPAPHLIPLDDIPPSRPRTDSA